MNNWLKQVKNSWNETSDSEWYKSLRSEEKIKGLIANPASAFHPKVYQLIHRHFPCLNGKTILLPSSGDNHAAFAFAVLGADVTSADISERQLENAKAVADKFNLNIRFVCEDTMTLSGLDDNQFDLVYTSNGTHTWITDLNSMYFNIARVLKPNGFSVMYDIHPFNRPFTGEVWQEPKIRKSYDDAAEYRHWRMQDLINATVAAGLHINEVAELQADNASFWFTYDDLIKQTPENIRKVNDWKHNPMAALPAWLSIVSQKQ